MRALINVPSAGSSIDDGVLAGVWCAYFSAATAALGIGRVLSACLCVFILLLPPSLVVMLLLFCSVLLSHPAYSFH